MKKFEKLLKLNLYNSSSLDDVKLYISKNLLPHKNQAGMVEYEYFGLGEQENLDKWLHPNFTYSINPYGFRFNTFELLKGANIGAFGCSFTFGQGLPTCMLWHDIIGKYLDKSVINFGTPAASISSVCDIFSIVTKHIKIDSAIMLLPSYSRLQLAKYSDNEELGILNCVPNTRGRFNSIYRIDDLEILKMIPDDELLKQAKNSIYQAEHIAKERNIKLFVSSWDLDTYRSLEQMDLYHAVLMPIWQSSQDLTKDFARDYRHPGPKHHKSFADNILPILNLYI